MPPRRRHRSPCPLSCWPRVTPHHPTPGLFPEFSARAHPRSSGPRSHGRGGNGGKIGRERRSRKGPCGWAGVREVPRVSQGIRVSLTACKGGGRVRTEEGVLSQGTHFRSPGLGALDTLTCPMTRRLHQDRPSEGPEHLVLRGTKAPVPHRHLLPRLQEGRGREGGRVWARSGATTSCTPRARAGRAERGQADLWPRASSGGGGCPETRGLGQAGGTCAQGLVEPGGSGLGLGGRDSAFYVLTSLASAWTSGLAALTAQGVTYTACPNSAGQAAGRLRRPWAPIPGAAPTITPAPQ